MNLLQARLYILLTWKNKKQHITCVEEQKKPEFKIDFLELNFYFYLQKQSPQIHRHSFSNAQRKEKRSWQPILTASGRHSLL